jgi:hypothetical protein
MQIIMLHIVWQQDMLIDINWPWVEVELQLEVEVEGHIQSLCEIDEVGIEVGRMWDDNKCGNFSKRTFSHYILLTGMFILSFFICFHRHSRAKY